jgi:hypothetical protein
MKSLKSAALRLAVLAFAGAGFAQSASAHDMMKSHKCSMMMKKMNMSSEDMQAMKTCKGMSHDAMMADQKCMSMMKNHGMM